MLSCCLGERARHHSWETTTEDDCLIPDAIEASTCWIRLPPELCFFIAKISKLPLASYARRQSGCWEVRALPNGISCRRSNQAWPLSDSSLQVCICLSLQIPQAN